MVEYRQALPVGFVLAGDYRITGVLGQGGFGITYKADDLRLGAPVAIKEYFPSELALREGGSTVEARSIRDQGVLEWGRAKFLDEAKTLARFRHPSIVRVARLFEANNTAYMVLDFEMGPSLAEWRTHLGREPSQAEVDRIVTRLLAAVGAVHEAGILHRDIKPANIIMRDGTEPVLIDFGAARQALSAQSRTVHAIVTPGYSPKEQYAVDLDRQGPWSDIYALGATLYFLVTGRAPPDALSRELGEPMQTAASTSGDWRPGFLAAIDRAMSVDADARPKSTDEWRVLLMEPAGADRAGRTGRTATTATRAVGAARPVPAAAAPSPRPASPSAARRVSFDDLPPAGAAAAVDKAAGASRGARAFVLSSLVAGAAAVAGLAYWILVAAPARDEAAWQSAVSAGTPAAFERYVSDQPSGRHVAEARRRASSASAGPAGVSLAARPERPPPASGSLTEPPPVAPSATGPSRSQPTAAEATAAAPAAPPTSTQSAQPAPPPPSATTPPERVASNDPATVPPTEAPKPVPRSSPAAPPTPTEVARPTPERIAPPEPGPARTEPAVSDSSSGPFSPRAALPASIPRGELPGIASAAAPGKWRLAVAGFGSDRVRGFTDQSGDFIAELDRIASNKLDVTPLAAGSAVPEGELFPRLAASRDLLAWHAPFSDMGRSLEFAIFSGAVPFGLDPTQHVLWLRADGARLLEQAYVDAGTPVRAIPCGVAGGVGAWFKKEVRSPSAFRGLKVQAPPLMERALVRLDARSVSVPSPRGLAAAFAGNRLDANFGVTPLTGVFLAQPRPAAVYHYPGVHNPAYLLALLMAPETWAAMAAPRQRLFDEACRRNLDRWAQQFASTESDVLDQIRRQRIVVRPFTGPVREALRKAVEAVLAEESAKSPRFKEILESYERFNR
ncbi:MAG: protein kinase [Hyphomicrobiaceae bacterium]